ncbi:hypothetical protein II906_01795 [bacterium]|nr:hypothetical protein [bacterium]
MTNTNKEKILSLIAQAHIGDSCFEKKYGFKINVEMLPKKTWTKRTENTRLSF